MNRQTAHQHADTVADILVALARDGYDVADWLAVVLATSAADLGSSDALVVGRSGSWEAALVLELLGGTVGPADEHLAHYRRTAGVETQDER